MAGYVFIGNSTKPNEEKRKSRDAAKISNVSRPCLQAALRRGYDVYLGVNRDNPEELACELPISLYDSHTYRSITAFGDNKTAYKNLCSLIKEKDINVIHCNTPVGGMVGRFAGKRHRVDKIIYTAHGFHFYKGAPLFNRTVLKWAEQIMAHWTDAIITLNQEDYEAAQKFKLRRGGKVYFVHGVGIETAAFASEHIPNGAIRQELGIGESDVMMISAGELNHNKNNQVLLRAMAQADAKNVHYILCGVGPLKEELEALAKELGIESRVHFLGYRNDIPALNAEADVYVMPSYREGLSRSMMEAMASGLPCLASRIRGNVDLIDEGKGGYLCAPDDAEGFAKAINALATDTNLRAEMRTYNLEKIKEYDISVVEKEIEAIYQEVLDK